MFQFTRDPSSGSSVQCLAKNYSNGFILSIDTDIFGVMAAYLPMVRVYTTHSREAL